jgi:hypothetical protein
LFCDLCAWIRLPDADSGERASSPRAEAGEATGIRGPLSLTTAADCDLAALEYDSDETAIRRFRESPE